MVSWYLRAGSYLSIWDSGSFSWAYLPTGFKIHSPPLAPTNIIVYNSFRFSISRRTVDLCSISQMPRWEEPVNFARIRYRKIIAALAGKFPRENLLLVTHGSLCSSCFYFSCVDSISLLIYCLTVPLAFTSIVWPRSFSPLSFISCRRSSWSFSYFICQGSWSISGGILWLFSSTKEDHHQRFSSCYCWRLPDVNREWQIRRALFFWSGVATTRGCSALNSAATARGCSALCVSAFLFFCFLWGLVTVTFAWYSFCYIWNALHFFFNL